MEQRANTTENAFSSPETFERQWQQLRGRVKGWWERLSEADLEQVAGRKDQLIRLVQEKYGYARERAEQEVDRRLREYRDAMGPSGTGRQGEAMSSTLEENASRLAATAGEVGTKMQGMATSAATSVAGTVSRTGAYLQDLPGDVAGLIRRYPIPSVLVGVGVGFLLARSLGRMQMISQWGGEGQAHDRERETGYPDAVIQCVRCGEMVRQSDMVSHSTTCAGTGVPGHGGSPT